MHNLSKTIAAAIVRNGIAPQSQYDRCQYGLELLLTTALTTCAILLVGIMTGTFIQTIVYIAVYWGIHSVAKTYHCSSFYRCFLLTTGLYTGMVVLTFTMDISSQYVFSWMLWVATCGILAGQIIDKDTAITFRKKQFIVYGVTMIVGFGLLISRISMLVLPFMYGMFVINLMQAKVRRKS